MWRALQVLALLVGAVVVQGAAGQLWEPLGAVDLVIIVSGLLALRLPFNGAVLTGSAAGLLQDSLSGGILGLHAFAKTAVNAGLASLGTVIVIRGQLAESLVIGAAAALEAFIVNGLLRFLDWPGGVTAGAIVGRAAATALATGLVTVSAPSLVVRWRRWRDRSRYALR